MKKKFTLKEIRAAGDDLNTLTKNFHPYPVLSPYISYFFVNYFPFTPNQISILWGIIGLIGAFFIAIGGYWYMLIGILIYHAGFILDCTDGELARLKKKTSLGGAYLDKFLHQVHRSVLVLALGIGVYNTSGHILYFYFGAFSSLFFMMDNIGKLKVYEVLANKNKFGLAEKMQESYKERGESKNKILRIMKKYSFEMLRPANPFTLLFFAILFNVAKYYLILMIIVTPIFFAKSFMNTYRELGNLSEK